MKIESLRIKNYKSFKDLHLKNLPAMCVFVGKNGVGKSTLFDVFSFLSDSLRDNVSVALAKRGGFNEVISRGQEGEIELNIQFRVANDQPKTTYELRIIKDGFKAKISREILKFRRGQYGQPWHFLDFSNGVGKAITNEDQYFNKDQSTEERTDFTLESPDILALKGLGQFDKFRSVSSFRKMIEGWNISDFHIDQARTIQETALAEHLSRSGDNLANYAKFLAQSEPEIFASCLKKMSERVAGIESVESVDLADGRVLLRFKDNNFVEPFIGKFVSDGTIKIFAYLLLLADPKPHPLLAVEEPENQLYHDLLYILAEEFRDYARRGEQIFITTHSPEFLNSVKVNELYALRKTNGFTTAHRIADSEIITKLIDNGDQLGYLWEQGIIDWQCDDFLGKNYRPELLD
ncbi:MAG: AAA family ATPase [Candidatus Pacebacteria bacterium]|nr:AAA family ATPase [Candidatus Paceibacterota bacterium]